MPDRSYDRLGGRISQLAVPAPRMTHEEVWVPNGREMTAYTRKADKPVLDERPREKPGSEKPEHQPDWGFDPNGSLVADGNGNPDDRPAKPPHEKVIATQPYFAPEIIGI